MIICSKHKAAESYCTDCHNEELKAERDRYEAAVREVLEKNVEPYPIRPSDIEDVMADIKQRLEGDE